MTFGIGSGQQRMTAPRRLSRQIRPQRHRSMTAVPETWRDRVQFVVLLQFAEQGNADSATLAAIVPGAGRHDLIEAIEDLLDGGLLHRPEQAPDRLDNVEALGRLAVSPAGLRLLADGRR